MQIDTGCNVYHVNWVPSISNSPP